MKRIFSKAILPAIAGVLLLGCYPNGPDYVEDLDVVYSTYDESFDFKAQSTYAMPDEIVKDVKIDNGDTTYIYVDPKFSVPILNEIEKNMTNLGWQRIAIPDDDTDPKPDVLVMPALITSTTYYYSYWYDWWYGGYYGWGWYYPPYYTVSSVTTGSLIMTMADPNIDNPINQSAAAWIGAANGVATGYSTIDRLLAAVNQAFAQSPYLKTN